MRLALAVCLLVAPALAGEQSLASRFPAGASAYVEVTGLGERVDGFLASPLGTSLSNSPIWAQLRKDPDSQEGLEQLEALTRATGLDAPALLKAVAGRGIAFAAYGTKARVVLMARMDAGTAERLIAGIEALTRLKRTQVRPAEEGKPAMFALAIANFFHDPADDTLVVTPDPFLAQSIRVRAAKGLQDDALYTRARERAGRATLFGYADLTKYPDAMKKVEKPKEFGAALFGGAIGHDLKNADWVAIKLDLEVDDSGARLVGEGFVPLRAGAEAVDASYRGTLGPLPFARPKRCVGVLRLRRDMQSIWSNREELIQKSGIPGMIEFETNFGNLAGGMSWVEEVLPNLGNELILLGSRRVFEEGKPAPAVKVPQGALVVPLKNAKQLGPKLQVAFNNVIAIINIDQGMMGNSLLPSIKEYKGIRLLEAEFMSAPSGEMDGREKLPIRFNFRPACAVVGDHFVMASHGDIVREIIDGYGKADAAPRGVNAGLWLEAGEIRKGLDENYDWLVAQTMVKEGIGKAEAEVQVKLLLGAARYLKGLALTAREERGTVGVRFELSLAPPWESRRG
ncbi:MAG: hypothetical protein ACYTGN_16320 [Planctomycetota bacterium]|jgi:hypothetical protein